MQYLGRGSDGRTPTFSQTDLLVQHTFKFVGTKQVQISLNVLNLFNQDTAVSKFSTYQKTDGVVPGSTLTAADGNEAPFYTGQQTLADLIVAQGVVKDPRFLQANGFQAPLQARFGLKFLF